MTMIAPLPSRLKIPDDLLATDLAAGEKALLHIQSGRYFALTPVAAWLWQTWSLNGSVQDSIDQLVQNYAIDRQTAETDVAELITELSRRQLITIVDDPD
jgi:hypothetical protein